VVGFVDGEFMVGTAVGENAVGPTVVGMRIALGFEVGLDVVTVTISSDTVTTAVSVAAAIIGHSQQPSVVVFAASTCNERM
jgi:hypothetical protein